MHPLNLQDDVVLGTLLLLFVKDVDVPLRRVYRQRVSVSSVPRTPSKGRGGNSHVAGMLKRRPSCARASSALTASSSSSISWKFSRMREGVTDLGMTECPPICDQARMTWAPVTCFPVAADSRSAMALTSGMLTSRGRPKLLFPKAEYAVIRMFFSAQYLTSSGWGRRGWRSTWLTAGTTPVSLMMVSSWIRARELETEAGFPSLSGGRTETGRHLRARS